MGKAVTITVSERQRSVLEGWIRNKAATSQRLFERCQMILMSAQGVSNCEQGRRLGVDRQRPRRWRTRWAACEEQLTAAEQQGANDKDFAKLVAGLLTDEPRAGVKPKFSAEQLTQLIALACAPPEHSGRPVTHWTPTELADEAAKRGVVDSISPRHVDRLLKGGICVHTRASTG